LPQPFRAATVRESVAPTFPSRDREGVGAVYTASVAPHLIQLDDSELKMLLVAIRQVQHTFTIAEAQSRAGGEPLAADYESVSQAYERLHKKLAKLIQGGGPVRPHIVK
jgi:hypothetical protein